ncbi:MAG: M20/M25/M40 family metallo-hydrolase, partial [Gemmatimonadales bacterium]|nr:M20/M25/M40 family metallo-hydrolase [Gemmatimonadales bacterium]
MPRALRIARRSLTLTLPLVFGAACAGGSAPNPVPLTRGPEVTLPRVRALLETIAHDSMEGRRAGSPGYARAARFVASEMRRIGLTPAGDSGFFQRIAAIRPPRGRMVVLPSFAAWDTVPPEQRLLDVNVLGLVEGVDPLLKHEVVVMAAHLDHLGISAHASGDSIHNGADDDASGVVTVLEAARVLMAGPRPKRTVVFALFTGEEGGPSGSRWYLEHPVRPFSSHVAQLQVEMVGRPDPMAGGRGKMWLTGYERSTMGEILTAAGVLVAKDPHPEAEFFRRSDNFKFAIAGIPAHTYSSYGMHTDYHQPGDDASTIDWAHFVSAVDGGARAIRILADGQKPAWKPNGIPIPPPPR